ncbi:Aste57867_7972 [Aphanomyces stellatus]|uniref:Aste57867_7972 protein n=1 Tax=Aphanomyces stellatus TaxID=120398 RepID=A0A485KJ36_9STRA|nr:hypothetical protein As57867_007942 [Aphanomyces stellatus]VFT84865.1 Aste57867_7972 [Aphanomyces stellatus]
MRRALGQSPSAKIAPAIPRRRQQSDQCVQKPTMIPPSTEGQRRSFKSHLAPQLMRAKTSVELSFRASRSLRERVAQLDTEDKGGPPTLHKAPSAVGRLQKMATMRSSRERKSDADHAALVSVFNLRKRRRRSSLDQADSAQPSASASSSLTCWTTIHPNSNGLRSWQILLMLVIFYQMIYVPYSMGFNPNIDGTVWATIDQINDALFVTDLVVNFHVAFYETFPPDDQRHLELRYSTDRAVKDKFLVRSRRRIAQHYVQGWFCLDALAAIPSDLFSSPTSALSPSPSSQHINYLSLVRVLRIPRLLGLFRILKGLKSAGASFFWWFEYSKGSIVMRLVRLLVIIFYIVHLMACAWYPVGSFAGGWGDTFLSSTSTSPTHNYVRCYYSMMMVVMGQDIMPVYEFEMLFLCVASIVGAVVIATIFGSVSMLIESLYSDAAMYHDKMEEVVESMAHLGLPSELQQRVHLYYTYLWQQYHTLDGKPAQFVDELSTNLQREVMLYLNANMIRSVPMMQECSPEVVQEIVSRLETRIYMPEDYVVSAGDTGAEMYFIQRGECDVIVAREKTTTHGHRTVETTKHIAAGDYFGGVCHRDVDDDDVIFAVEIALMMDCRRTATVRARTFCVLGVLGREHFRTILGRHNEDRVRLEAMIMDKYKNDVHRPAMAKAKTETPPMAVGGGGDKVLMRMLWEATTALGDVSARVGKLESGLAELTQAMTTLAASHHHHPLEERRRDDVTMGGHATNALEKTGGMDHAPSARHIIGGRGSDLNFDDELTRVEDL